MIELTKSQDNNQHIHPPKSIFGTSWQIRKCGINTYIQGREDLNLTDKFRKFQRRRPAVAVTRKQRILYYGE